MAGMAVRRVTHLRAIVEAAKRSEARARGDEALALLRRATPAQIAAASGDRRFSHNVDVVSAMWDRLRDLVHENKSCTANQDGS